MNTDNSPEAVASPHRLKFLLVNDCVFQLHGLQAILGAQCGDDLEMVTAINGDQAVRTIQQNMSEFYQYNSPNRSSLVEQPIHFDVIILDLSMPIMDGYKACEKILEIYRQYDEKQIRQKDTD